MLKQYSLIRNAEVGNLLEIFLISAVSAILLIRFYLRITGYPQLGGGPIHIAHMLWGGLLLLLALIMVLSFLGNRVLKIAAVTGGIGFGTFIDELGKFITKDNDYFFQPTVSLLYIIFLFLFFASRYIEQHQPLSKKEYLMNALRLLEEVVEKDMDKHEKRKLILYLEESDINDEMTKKLKTIVKNVKVLSPPKPNKIIIIYNKIINFLDKTIKSSIAKKFVIVFFIFEFLSAFMTIVFVLFQEVSNTPSRLNPIPANYVVFAWGEFVSKIVSIIMIGVGLFLLRKSKLKAYTYFKYSLLVYLLFTQFFMFYREQFNALFGLVFNILILVSLNYLIGEEKKITTNKDLNSSKKFANTS